MKDDTLPKSKDKSPWDVIPDKTLRDEFAMAALTGILACPEGCGNYQTMCDDAYKCADAMLKAREAHE